MLKAHVRLRGSESAEHRPASVDVLGPYLPTDLAPCWLAASPEADVGRRCGILAVQVTIVRKDRPPSPAVLILDSQSSDGTVGKAMNNCQCQTSPKGAAVELRIAVDARSDIFLVANPGPQMLTRRMLAPSFWSDIANEASLRDPNLMEAARSADRTFTL